LLYLLHAVDGFALAVDRVSLFNGRSFAQRQNSAIYRYAFMDLNLY